MNIKLLYILLVTLLFSTCYYAQGDIEGYSFLVLDSNKIGNPRSIEKIISQRFKKDSTSSQLKIFIIGDSHVASGGIAKSLNSTLAEEFGDGGKVYLPLNKEFPSSMGHKDIKISSTEKSINGFTLLSNTTSDKLSIKDASGNNVEIKSTESLENHTIKVNFSNELPEFYISAAKNVPTVYSKGLITSTTESGVVTTWYGVVGASLLSYNINMNYIYPFIEAYAPDILIINLGTNDCTGENFNLQYVSVEYDRLIQKLKKTAPKAALLLISPPDFFSYRGGKHTFNKMVKVMREGIVKLSEKHDLSYWDLKAVMGGDSSMITWVKAGLGSKDYIHFTNEGHVIVGKLLGKAIIDLFKEDQ